ncbi:MAG: universal stress protein [Halomonadaceae bacterium]|nr:MAG: universal stress protein [Halomonadaceae bacterium]
MFKHGIVGVDFSEGWQNAEPQLPPLLKLLGTERLTLVAVDEIHRWQHEGDDEKANREVSLRQLAVELQGRYQIPVDHQVRHGFPASELVAAASELHGDVIVVGNSSHSVYRDFILGNVTLNLARMAQLPVLILPVDAKPVTEGAPLLLATDSSKAASRAENCFKALVQGVPGGQVLMVTHGHGEAASPAEQSQAEALAESLGEKVGFSPLQGDPGTEITAYARDHGARLVILGKRGKTDMRELPLGSTAETVCRLAVTPLLLVPQRIVNR